MIQKLLYAAVGLLTITVSVFLIQGDMPSAFLGGLMIFALIGIIKALEKWSTVSV